MLDSCHNTLSKHPFRYSDVFQAISYTEPIHKHLLKVSAVSSSHSTRRKHMKKFWNAPQLSVHGSVEAITEKTVAKKMGLGDDLFTVAETNAGFGDEGLLS
jgi:hypothetical protein